MVSVAKSLCSTNERTRRGRSPSTIASPQAVLTFDNEMYLPVKTTKRRCAYCSTDLKKFCFQRVKRSIYVRK